MHRHIVTVVGVFETGTKDVDRNIMQVPFGLFSEMFEMRSHVHQVIIKLNSLDDLRPVQENLIAGLPKSEALRVLRWDELVPGLKQAIELDMASGANLLRQFGAYCRLQRAQYFLDVSAGENQGVWRFAGSWCIAWICLRIDSS